MTDALFSRRVFWTISVLLAIVLGDQAWNLSPLYLDPAMRCSVQHAVQSVADERGWLLSDLSFGFVPEKLGSLVVTHHDHLRFAVPSDVVMVPLSSFPLAECALR